MIVGCILTRGSLSKVSQSISHQQGSASSTQSGIPETKELNSLFAQLRADADNAYRKGDLATALSVYERAEELAKRLNLKDNLGPLLYRIGRCNFGLNRFEKARSAFIRGKAILEGLEKKTPGTGTAYLIYTIGDLGTLYLHMREYAEAKKTALESLIFAESVNASANPFAATLARRGIAVALAILGNVAASEGEYESSLSYLQKSLSLFSQISAADPRYEKEIAERLTDMGEAHKYAGDHVQALHCFTRAFGVAQQVGHKPTLHRVLVSLGILYLDQGDYTIATEYLQEALTIAEELSDKVYQFTGTTNLGFSKLRQGDHEGALGDFERALANSRGTEAHHATIPIYEGLAAVYLAKHRYEQAIELFDKALEIVVRLGDKSREAEILWWKGEALYAQGKYMAALVLSEDAYSLTQQLGLLNISRLALTLKGKIYCAQEQYDLARPVLSLAIETIEHMRAKAAGQEQVRALFLEGKLEPYHLMIELLIKQHKNSEALMYAERAKSRILLEVMQSGKSNVKAVLTPGEREKDRRLNAEIVSLNSELYAEKLRSQSDKRRLEGLSKALDKARLEYQAFRDGIYVAHPDLRAQQETPTYTLDEPSTLLSDSQSALLEFVVMDEKTYLFVISASSYTSAQAASRAQISSFPIAVKRSDLKQRVDEFRERIAHPHFVAQGAARRLYDLLLGPAATLLADKTSLVLVPDGVLWDLPFQALRQKENRYLIEEHVLSYAPSLSVLREARRRRDSATASPQVPRPHLLAFGNPKLSRRTIEQVTTIHRDEKLLPLPEAEREVVSLKQLYGSTNSQVYIGAAALEQTAKREIGNCRVLHFATHAILDGANPMYSGIVLTSGDGTTEDGLLEAWEIINLDLNADIAVLSSCNTARGRIGAGEGVIGMSWAFLVAGCPTTVVSQWQVDSASTTALMIAFHKNLVLGSKRSGQTEKHSNSPSYRMSKAQALRHAMLTLIRDNRFKSPYYWAGFVVIGDGH
jgi:CHAT domain-containing protein/Tfp pilus assembly protein PilF